MNENELRELQEEIQEFIREDEYDKAINAILPILPYLNKNKVMFEVQGFFLLLGISYLNLKDLENALSYLEKSAEIEMHKADAYGAIGMVYKMQDMLNEAEENFKKMMEYFYIVGIEALELPGMLYNYGVTIAHQHSKFGKPLTPHALHLFKDSILIDPSYAKSYESLSYMLLTFGEKKLYKKFLKAFKSLEKGKLKDKDYLALIIELQTYLYDENYHDGGFVLTCQASNNAENVNINRSQIAPSFTDIKEVLIHLWESKQEGKIALAYVYESLDDKLIVHLKKDTTGQYSFEIEAALDGNGIASYQTTKIKEVIHILNTFFFYHILATEYTFEVEDIDSDEYKQKILMELEPSVINPFVEKTNIPFNEIILSKTEDDPYSSKIGGTPYLPKDYTYPVTESGAPLRLLAQIKFEDMPALSDFPTTGILQFYILEGSEDESMYGANLDNSLKQNTFRVIYHKNVDKSIELQQVRDSAYNEDEGVLSKDACLAMSFENEKMPMTATDFRFEDTFIGIYNDAYGTQHKSVYDIDEAKSEIIFDNFMSPGHRISGYAHFTQTDPREYGNKDKELLLLQIDSEDIDDVSIMWGDCGVANFFISREDLLNCDFSNVLYTWDCY